MQLTERFDCNNAPKSLLLITAERVGDTLFTMPAIKLLKQNLPTTRLDVLTFSEAAASLFSHNPHVADVLVANKNFSFRRDSHKYPYLINLMHEMLKKIPDKLENLISIQSPDTRQHRTWQVIEFIKQIVVVDGRPIEHEYPLYPQPEHQRAILATFNVAGLDMKQHSLIGFQLGCHRVARRGWKIWDRYRYQHKKVWPIEYYIELAQQLMAVNPNLRILITGSDKEKYLAKMFLRQVPSAINMIGKTSLLELTAMMDHLKLLITHDTGTMHIAAARSTPIIALFAATPVCFTGPYPEHPRNTILEANEITAICVDDVYKKVVAKLSGEFVSHATG